MTAQEQILSIAARAANLKKPNKRDAQAMVRKLFDECPGHREELAALYNYFMPSIPKNPKTDFDWVAKAMADKHDVREYMQYVHITRDWIEATDGHRLHRAPNAEGLEPGFYNKAGDKVHGPEYARYPDTSRVIPNIQDRGLETTSTDGLEVDNKGDLVVYKLENGSAVNKQYLDQCMGNKVGTVRAREANGSIRIDMDERLAVIMPIRW